MGKINVRYNDGNIGGVIASQDGISGYIHFNNVIVNTFPRELPKVMCLRQAKDLNKYGIYGTPQEMVDNGVFAPDATEYGLEITASDVTDVITLEFASPVSGKQIKIVSTIDKLVDNLKSEAKNDFIAYYDVRDFSGMSTFADVLDNYFTVSYDSGDLVVEVKTAQPNLSALFTSHNVDCDGATCVATYSDRYDICQVYQNIADYFKQSPDSVLYFSLTGGNTTDDAIDDMTAIINASEGQVRQIAYASGSTLIYDYAPSFITALNTFAEQMAGNKKPFSIILGDAKPIYRASKATAVNCRSYSAMRVSCVVTAIPYAFQYSANTAHSIVGEVLGLVSKNKVSDSIAWVGNNPMLYGEYDVDINTDTVDYSWMKASDLTSEDIDSWQGNGWILPMSYVGNSARFINTDNNSSAPLSDYNSIKRVRTMDKIARLSYQALVPFISSPLYVDKATGFLSEMTAQKFESVISTQLTTMENAYEVSGFSVEIPAEQNILQTATLEVNVKAVPVGSADVININLSYAVQI